MEKKDVLTELFNQFELNRSDIEELAFDTGFCCRSGKINPSDFLIHLCLESQEGTVSYNDLAASIESSSNINASRQAYHKRMNDPCVAFFKAVLERIMLSNISETEIKICQDSMFKRILIQDSTVIRLPTRLFEVYSGVKNAHSQVCNARIQGIYDLISGQFIDFRIDPYSRNDLVATLDIQVQEGDLLLRDRGYFTCQAIQIHKYAKADCIFRYKHKTALYDAKTQQPIDLLLLLQQNDNIDIPILVGDIKAPARLVAARAKEEVANVRRMKAKRESSGKNPSKELLQLMSWTIYITTVTLELIGFNELLDLYALRWRIENIFKTWKSNFSFSKIHNVSARQLEVLIIARFIMIVIFYKKLFLPFCNVFKKNKLHQISLMKFMRYISRNLVAAKKSLSNGKLTKRFKQALIRYCSYDERKRSNFDSKAERIFEKNNMKFA